MSRACVFLDRDGTLIEEREYAHRLEDYAPLPGAYEAVRALRAAGFAVVVVTNQAGIGRGYFGADDYERFRAHLEADFARRGAPLDATFHCPHAPAEGCACRKPEPGMLERARREHDLELGASFVVGDKAIDVEVAARVGAQGVLVGTGYGTRDRDRVPDGTPCVDDVRAAADWITERARRSS